jgi:hypothetical protein
VRCIGRYSECLQSGAPFRTTIADGVAAQKLADAAALSLVSICAHHRPIGARVDPDRPGCFAL